MNNMPIQQEKRGYVMNKSAQEMSFWNEIVSTKPQVFQGESVGCHFETHFIGANEFCYSHQN